MKLLRAIVEWLNEFQWDVVHGLCVCVCLCKKMRVQVQTEEYGVIF